MNLTRETEILVDRLLHAGPDWAVVVERDDGVRSELRQPRAKLADDLGARMARVDEEKVDFTAAATKESRRAPQRSERGC